MRPNNTDDYIRRGDAIEAVHDRICQIGYERNANVLSIRQAVRDVPAADVVERKKGKWAKQQKDFDLCGVEYFACSQCGFECQLTYNFCPDCGAKMDGDL